MSEDTRLTHAQLLKVMELIPGANSVELKLTVQSTEHRATIAALPLDPVEAEPRQVFFFDTPGLALNRAGVVVRARRRPGGDADTVIKRPPTLQRLRTTAEIAPVRLAYVLVDLDLDALAVEPIGAVEARPTRSARRLRATCEA